MFSPDWSKGKLKKISNCPVCGNNQHTNLEWSRADNDGFFPDIWHFAQCAYCKSLYLNPRPDSESISEAYAQYYTHEAPEGTVSTAIGRRLLPAIHGYLRLRFGLKRAPENILTGILFFLIEPLRLKLDYYARHLPRNPKTVFDVGCGNGDFLLRARDMGWIVAGCDPDPKAVETARKHGLDVTCGFPDQILKEKSFEWDVITLGHVIEHVEDPLGLMRSCHAALKKGGQIWLATPNPLSVGLRFLNKFWMPLHPPYHFCIIHPDALRQILKEAGFEDIRFMRRGMQSKNQWLIAASLAEREGAPFPKLKLLTLKWISDFLATVNSKRAEEIVVIAKKF